MTGGRRVPPPGCIICACCGAPVRDDPEDFEVNDPLALELGEHPVTRKSLRMQTRVQAYWLIQHVEDDVIDLAKHAYRLCGEVLFRIGRPR